MSKEITKHNQLFASTISLIPSENFGFYEDYKKQDITDIGNRYCFLNNSNFSSAFPGHEHIEEIQRQVERNLEELLEVSYVNIDGISGMNGLTCTISAFLCPGDIIAIVHPKNGGHISTEKISKKLGARVIYIPFLEDNPFRIDYEKLKKILIAEEVKLLYVDQMNGLYPIDLSPVIGVSQQTVKFYDVSHNAAFVISRVHKNPLENGFDCFGGSTHKSIPGPHKFFFCTNNKKTIESYKSSAQIFISNNNIESTLKLQICIDNMKNKWVKYTENIIANNIFFAEILKKIGIKLIYDKEYSQNHQLFWYIDNFEIDKFHEKLSKSGIFVNKLPLPFIGNKYGFRSGMQELTFIGGTKKDVLIIGAIINSILKSKDEPEVNKQKIKTMKTRLLKNFSKIHV